MSSCTDVSGANAFCFSLLYVFVVGLNHIFTLYYTVQRDTNTPRCFLQQVWKIASCKTSLQRHNAMPSQRTCNIYVSYHNATSLEPAQHVALGPFPCPLRLSIWIRVSLECCACLSTPRCDTLAT